MYRALCIHHEIETIQTHRGHVCRRWHRIQGPAAVAALQGRHGPFCQAHNGCRQQRGHHGSLHVGQHSRAPVAPTRQPDSLDARPRIQFNPRTPSELVLHHSSLIRPFRIGKLRRGLDYRRRQHLRAVFDDA